MSNNHPSVCLTLCLMLMSSGAIAAPTADPLPVSLPDTHEKKPSPEDVPTPVVGPRIQNSYALHLEHLETIQAETVLYEAQLARAKALNELQKNGYDHTLEPPFNPAPSSQDDKTEIKGTGMIQNTALPQILEITGAGSGYLAVLSLFNGNQITVQAGQRIPGTDYVVKRITLNEVVISGKNQSLISLSFAG